jgi:hypothetical protein
MNGGQGRNRTADASLFRAALYQLSYLAGVIISLTNRSLTNRSAASQRFHSLTRVRALLKPRRFVVRHRREDCCRSHPW